MRGYAIINVLIVHPHMAFYGGAETLILKLYNYLTKKGIECKIVTLSVTPKISEICKDVDIVTPEKSHDFMLRSTSFISAIGVFNEQRALQSLVRENIDQFDLVNPHNFPSTWSVFPNSWKKPIVWMCNEPPDLWNNQKPSIPLKFLRKAGLICDRYIVNKVINEICVSDEFNYSRVLERYGKTPNIVHYGIEHDLFSKGDNKNVLERFGLYDKFVLLQVGVLSPQKNQLESIKTIEKLRENIPNIKLILAGLGDNSYAQMLMKYVSNSGLNEHIIFTGHTSKQEIADLYKACNVALFPIKSQGGWLSPFEALCAERPIIVSNEMTASDLIKEKNIGVVTDDFSETVLNIYHNPDKYYEMAEGGGIWVRENLSWDKYCEKMLNVFYKVIGA